MKPPLLYKNLIPLSRLSSEPDSPNSKIGSSIDTVVELTVVVVPLTVKLPETVKFPEAAMFVDVISSEFKTPETVKSFVTVKSFPIVTSFGKPTVIVCPLAEVSTSFIVPAIVSDCESRSTAPVPESPATSKS